jgi:hypothetical protein
MGPYKENKSKSKDMKYVRSTEGKTRRGSIGNKTSREEVGNKNLLTE